MAFAEKTIVGIVGEADRQAPPADVLLVSASEAARLCGVGLTTWYSLIAQGRVPPSVRLGRRRLWSVEELREWTRARCPASETWTWGRSRPLRGQPFVEPRPAPGGGGAP